MRCGIAHPDAPEHLAAWFASLGVSTRFDGYGVAADESRATIAAALDGTRGGNFIGAISG